MLNYLKDKWTKNIGKSYFEWFKRKCNSATYNSNQKRNNDKYQCECKKYHTSNKDKDYSWNPSTCICEYCSSIADDSVIVCGEIVNAIGSI